MNLRTAPSADRHHLHIDSPVVVDGPGVRLCLTGALDGLNTEPLTEAFTAALAHPAAGRVELDVGGLTFLDSGGIRALLRCRSAAGRSGRSLRLTDPPPMILKVLTVTGLSEVFGLDG
jgi:anti-anti-sigma factor